MPWAIESDPGLHYVAFGTIKLIGYTGYSFVLRRIFSDLKKEELSRLWHGYGAGVSRTIIGLFFGMTIAAWLLDLSYGPLVFYGALIPLRFIEWFILIWLFYDRKLEHKKTVMLSVVFGISVSFLLDIPAALGFIFTGGMWIC